MEKEALLTKDTLTYLLNFADDREILILLSIKWNMFKQLPDNFFKNLMSRKYPYLMKYKMENETWRRFYLKVVKYVAISNERFQTEYIPLITTYIGEKEVDFEEFYQENKNKRKGLSELTEQVLRGGGNYVDLNMLFDNLKVRVTKYRDDWIKTLNDLIGVTTESGDINLLIMLIERGANDYPEMLEQSAFFGNIDMVKYIIKNFLPKIPKNEVTRAINSSQDDEVKDYLKNFE